MTDHQGENPLETSNSKQKVQTNKFKQVRRKKKKTNPNNLPKGLKHGPIGRKIRKVFKSYKGK